MMNMSSTEKSQMLGKTTIAQIPHKSQKKRSLAVPGSASPKLFSGNVPALIIAFPRPHRRMKYRAQRDNAMVLESTVNS
jgi:hypothetical protein